MSWEPVSICCLIWSVLPHGKLVMSGDCIEAAVAVMFQLNVGQRCG